MNLLKETKSSLFIMAGFYIIVGIIMLFAPIFINNLFVYIIGSICIIVSGLAIYSYFNLETDGIFAKVCIFVSGIFALLGIFIIINPQIFTSFIPFVIGFILIVEAIHKMHSAVQLRKYDYNKWWQVLIIAIMVLFFGLLLMFNPFKSVIIFIRILGVFLILDGISNIFTAISYSKIEKSIN